MVVAESVTLAGAVVAWRCTGPHDAAADTLTAALAPVWVPARRARTSDPRLLVVRFRPADAATDVDIGGGGMVALLYAGPPAAFVDVAVLADVLVTTSAEGDGTDAAAALAVREATSAVRPLVALPAMGSGFDAGLRAAVASALRRNAAAANEEQGAAAPLRAAVLDVLPSRGVCVAVVLQGALLAAGRDVRLFEAADPNGSQLVVPHGAARLQYPAADAHPSSWRRHPAADDSEAAAAAGDVAVGGLGAGCVVSFPMARAFADQPGAPRPRRFGVLGPAAPTATGVDSSSVSVAAEALLQRAAAQPAVEGVLGLRVPLRGVDAGVAALLRRPGLQLAVRAFGGASTVAVVAAADASVGADEAVECAVRPADGLARTVLLGGALRHRVAVTVNSRPDAPPLVADVTYRRPRLGAVYALAGLLHGCREGGAETRAAAARRATEVVGAVLGGASSTWGLAMAVHNTAAAANEGQATVDKAGGAAAAADGGPPPTKSVPAKPALPPPQRPPTNVAPPPPPPAKGPPPQPAKGPPPPPRPAPRNRRTAASTILVPSAPRNPLSDDNQATVDKAGGAALEATLLAEVLGELTAPVVGLADVLRGDETACGAGSSSRRLEATLPQATTGLQLWWLLQLAIRRDPKPSVAVGGVEATSLFAMLLKLKATATKLESLVRADVHLFLTLPTRSHVLQVIDRGVAKTAQQQRLCRLDAYTGTEFKTANGQYSWCPTNQRFWYRGKASALHGELMLPLLLAARDDSSRHAIGKFLVDECGIAATGTVPSGAYVSVDHVFPQGQPGMWDHVEDAASRNFGMLTAAVAGAVPCDRSVVLVLNQIARQRPLDGSTRVYEVAGQLYRQAAVAWIMRVMASPTITAEALRQLCLGLKISSVSVRHVAEYKTLSVKYDRLQVYSYGFQRSAETSYPVELPFANALMALLGEPGEATLDAACAALRKSPLADWPLHSVAATVTKREVLRRIPKLAEAVVRDVERALGPLGAGTRCSLWNPYQPRTSAAPTPF